MSDNIEAIEAILQKVIRKDNPGSSTLGIKNPKRGELYRFYSPCVPNGFYYIQWLNWATSPSDGSHIIVCPRLKFFEETSNIALGWIHVWSKGSLAALLGEILDPLEKTIAGALLCLAEKSCRREVKKGQITSSELGPILPPLVFHEVGVDEWRLFVCCKWCQWEEAKVTWEARAADVRDRYPGTKMTRDRLRRECAKDRLGLQA
jgi:hypothetical protein